MDYFITCPHCDGLIAVNKNEINCAIFRHAIYKSNLNPINPHASKEICENLLNTDQVYGCAKPFRVNLDVVNNKLNIYICDYI